MESKPSKLKGLLEDIAEGTWQKLLTKDDAAKLPPLYSQENVEDPIAQVKFFSPWSNYTAYAVEFDQKDTFFGLVQAQEEELGYFSLSEFQSAKGPGGVPAIERDMYFKPTPLSKLRGKSERLELVKSSDMDRLKTGFMGETDMARLSELKAGMMKYKSCACGKPIEKGQSIVKAAGKWVHDDPDCVAIAKGEKEAPKVQEPEKEPVAVAETQKENDMSTKMQETLESIRRVIGEETVAAMTGPIATPLAVKKVERTFPKDEEEDIKGQKAVGSPTPQAGGDPSNYGKEATKSSYPHGIKTEEKMGGGGDAFKTAPKAPSEVKSGAAAKKEEPKGDKPVGTPKAEKGGDSALYGKEQKANKTESDKPVEAFKSAPKSTETVKDPGPQKDPSPKGDSVVGKPKEAKVDKDIKAYDAEKKLRELGKIESKLSEANKSLQEFIKLEADGTVAPSIGEPIAAAPESPSQDSPEAAPAEQDPAAAEVKYREIHISNEYIPDQAAQVKQAVAEVLPDAEASIVLKFQGDMAKAEAGKAALEAAGLKVMEID